MRKEKINLRVVLSLVLGIMIFAACDSDDPKPIALEANTDVFVQKIYEDGEEKFAIALLVTANQDLDSVTVTGPGSEGEVYNLTADASSKRLFSLMPDSDDFTTDSIAVGDYEFVVSSRESEVENLAQTDALEDLELDRLVIDSTSFNNEELKANWQSLENADSYVVKLFNTDGTIIYNSPKIDADQNEFAFGTNDDTGWINTNQKAEVGETYQVEVWSILFESGVAENVEDYNIQYISLDSKEIIWGE